MHFDLQVALSLFIYFCFLLLHFFIIIAQSIISGQFAVLFTTTDRSGGLLRVVQKNKNYISLLLLVTRECASRFEFLFSFLFPLDFYGWKICSSFIIGSICNFWDPFNCKCVFSALEVWSILPQNIWDWFLRHRGFNNLRVTGKLGLRFAAWFGEWCDWLVKSLLLCCLVIIWSPPLISTAKPAWAFY